MEPKIKHLEFIQTAIGRMANNSFLLKGWSITVTAALFAASLKESDPNYLRISITIIVFFWLLDGYYLSKERLFRKLFDVARVAAGPDSDFSMDTTLFRPHVSWPRCTLSATLNLFYGGLLVAHLIFVLLF